MRVMLLFGGFFIGKSTQGLDKSKNSHYTDCINCTSSSDTVKGGRDDKNKSDE